MFLDFHFNHSCSKGQNNSQGICPSDKQDLPPLLLAPKLSIKKMQSESKNWARNSPELYPMRFHVSFATFSIASPQLCPTPVNGER